jgi:hypothetical protein
MSDKRTYTGDSIGEALERAHKELPAGSFILDLKKHEAKAKSAEASALTAEEALAQARKALPPEAAVVEEKVLREREEGRMELRAFQADEARAEAEARFLVLAEKSDRELLEGLIRQGVNLGARDAKGASALMVSAFYGKPETSLLLIEAGVDVNLKDNGGFTALMVACESAAGPIRVVERLIEKGARLDDRNLDHNITALIWAANGGHRPIVEFLLSKGADRTIQTFNGYTAASIAAENGHQDIARLLC